MAAKKPEFERHDKGWGEELIHYNDLLCVKSLIVQPGKWSSMHFHRDKDEIFLVERGRLILEWVDTRNADVKTVNLSPGDMIQIKPMTPHRFTAWGEHACVFKEFSTHHDEADSYRVGKGASQS